MNLDDIPVGKIDEDLRKRLGAALINEQIRVIASVADGLTEEKSTLPSSQFASRAEYRQYKIASQKEKTKLALEPVLESLNSLNLIVKFSDINPVIFAEGSPIEIFKLLQIPQIRHVSLDKNLEFDLGSE